MWRSLGPPLRVHSIPPRWWAVMWDNYPIYPEKLLTFQFLTILKWRRWMGIEPTSRVRRLTGFEDQGSHQTPFTSNSVGAATTGLGRPQVNIRLSRRSQRTHRGTGSVRSLCRKCGRAGSPRKTSPIFHGLRQSPNDTHRTTTNHVPRRRAAVRSTASSGSTIGNWAINSSASRLASAMPGNRASGPTAGWIEYFTDGPNAGLFASNSHYGCQFR